MDINAALERMRQLTAQLDRLGSIPTDDLADSDITALSALAGQAAITFEALDGWLSKGGFLPYAWHRASDAQS